MALAKFNNILFLALLFTTMTKPDNTDNVSQARIEANVYQALMIDEDQADKSETKQLQIPDNNAENQLDNDSDEELYGDDDTFLDADFWRSLVENEQAATVENTHPPNPLTNSSKDEKDNDDAGATTTNAEQPDTLVARIAGPSTGKAGLENVDKERINRIIYELSKVNTLLSSVMILT
jgi:hypothetical protein